MAQPEVRITVKEAQQLFSAHSVTEYTYWQWQGNKKYHADLIFLQEIFALKTTSNQDLVLVVQA